MTFIEEASKEFNMEPPLCEHTIRKCIETLQQYEVDACHVRLLESLLPKKDRAAELVEAFNETAPQGYIDGVRIIDPDLNDARLRFANWLISQNLINEKGAL